MMHGADHRPVRVLHVFSNFVPSGPELRAIRLIEALGPRFLHAVVSMDGRTTAAAHLSDPGLIRILPSPPKAGSLATVRRLRRILAEEDPDLVLSYGWGAIDTLPAAASLRLRSLVHHEEGFNADEALTFKRRRVWARRLLLPAAHHVVVPSRRLHAIATGLWKVAEERVRLIPNGIPTDSFPRADRDPEFRLRLRIPRDAFLVGTVAQLRPVKNIGRLIDAVAALRSAEVHLMLVGDGPERATLEARAADAGLGGRVLFAGHQTDVAAHLRALDLFALTSDSEQMPVSLLEAMACGLPVVATDVGDVRGMLPEDQHPFLTPPQGPDPAQAIATHIAALHADPALRDRLGAANRERIRERYDSERMAQDYLAVYRSALSARRQG
jgi:glycosyltransferase involved in cell wall biosynthesis